MYTKREMILRNSRSTSVRSRCTTTEGRDGTGVSDIPAAVEETGQKWRQKETRKRFRETRAKHACGKLTSRVFPTNASESLSVLFPRSNLARSPSWILMNVKFARNCMTNSQHPWNFLFLRLSRCGDWSRIMPRLTSAESLESGTSAFNHVHITRLACCVSSWILMFLFEKHASFPSCTFSII